MVNDNEIFSTNPSEPETVRFKENILNDAHMFKTVPSSASCKISDINGFVFGGMTSRFWMLRKYVIGNPKSSNKTLLKSWQCITLQLKHRDIDLIIRDDEEMKRLIKFLLFSLRSVNG